MTCTSSENVSKNEEKYQGVAAHRGHGGGPKEYTCRFAKARKASVHIAQASQLCRGSGAVPNFLLFFPPLVYSHHTLTRIVTPQADMSDNEGHGSLPSTDDDLSLPKATVAKMISGENRSHAPAAFCASLTLQVLRYLPSRVPAKGCFVRKGDKRLDY